VIPDQTAPFPCTAEDVQWAFTAAIDGHETGRAEYLAVCFKACRFCPVRRSCYEQGVATHSYGVWGGIDLEGRAVRNAGLECTRGHDITGRNGKKRSDGTVGCRICNHARDSERARSRAKA